jgi:Flp pilus assembly protein CpaB
MRRFRLPLVILGIAGALVVMAAVFLVIRAGRGTPVELPVAIDDIPPGTPLDPAQFRLQAVRGLDPTTLDAYITADEFAPYAGLPLLETVHAGFPVGKAQVRTADPNARQSRLTLLLSGAEGDEDHLVYPLPVSADQVGDFLVAGDRVDVILTLGRVAAQEMTHVEAWEVEAPSVPGATLPLTPTQPPPSLARPGATLAVTTTLPLPVAKVVITDVLVLRVEREQIRSAGVSYGMGTGADEEMRRPQTVEGEIVRLYLELDREQAEVLSFALHNGALNLPARAVPAGGASQGFSWDDFQELFFRDRPQAQLRGEE